MTGIIVIIYFNCLLMRRGVTSGLKALIESRAYRSAESAAPPKSGGFRNRQGSATIEPLGPTIRAPPSGNGLIALNLMPDFLCGLILVGSWGGRKSKMKSS